MKYVALYEMWPFNNRKKKPEIPSVPEFVEDWEDEEEIFDLRENFYKILKHLTENPRLIKPSNWSHTFSFTMKGKEFGLSHTYITNSPSYQKKMELKGEGSFSSGSRPDDFMDLVLENPDRDLSNLFDRCIEIANENLIAEQERRKRESYRKYFGDISN